MPDAAVSLARDKAAVDADQPAVPDATPAVNALSMPRLFEDVVREHFAGILGSIMCTMTALVVVIIFRVSAGPIEFDTPLGFKFKGASGPVVLWVFAFLACVAGTTALWNLRH